MYLDQIMGQIIDFLIFMAPFAAFYFFTGLIYREWKDFAKDRFEASKRMILLRVYPPKVVNKTPLAMELFLNTIFQTSGESTAYDRIVLGKRRAIFSLEMVSHEGEVAFYIHSRAELRRQVETQIYAHYPGSEVVEVDDYTAQINFDEYVSHAVEFELTGPDPLPIKTYVDYGLDKTKEEEEEKVDPITSTLEFLGSLKKGEHIWVQIITRAHKKEDQDPNSWFGKIDTWQEEAKQLIKEIRAKASPKNADGTLGFPNPTKGEIEKINAIEKSVAKPGFDCGIRAMYIAKSEAFDKDTRRALSHIFKQYNTSNLNGFKTQNDTGDKYPWQLWFWDPRPGMRRQMYEDYRKRKYFGSTYVAINAIGFPYWKDRRKFILSAEELATIYHFPGQAANTPSLKRVPSRKGEAPDNLPI